METKLYKKDRRFGVPAKPRHSAALVALSAITAMAADGPPDTRQIFDKQLSAVESEVMKVVETMPASRFGFAPAEGAFKTVRTFGGQARHIAFCLNEVAVARHCQLERIRGTFGRSVGCFQVISPAVTVRHIEKDRDRKNR